MSANSTTFSYLLGLRNNPQQIAEIKNAVRGKKRVILHFHGGLSSPEYITGTLGPLLQKHQFQSRWFENTHVIFVMYESEVLQPDNYGRLFRKIVSEAFQESLIGWLLRRLGISSFSEERRADDDSARVAARWLQELQGQDPEGRRSDELYFEPFEELVQDVLAQKLVDTDAEFATYNEQFMRSVAESLAPAAYHAGLNLELGKAIIRTLRRCSIHTDHGHWNTIVEELFRVPALFGTSISDLPQAHWATVEDHAVRCWKPGADGYRLLEILNNEYRSRSPAQLLDVELICHSAGSLVICEAINALKRMRRDDFTLKFGALLFVAPAVRMTAFQHAVMDNNANDLFNRVLVYALEDKAEATDRLIKVLYSSSLLYFVSGVAEKAGDGDMSILGLHRHFDTGRKPYIDPRYEHSHENVLGRLEHIRNFLGANRVVLCPNNSTVPGVAADATTHENSKLPDQTPVLASSIVYQLTGGAFCPTASEILNPL